MKKVVLSLVAMLLVATAAQAQQGKYLNSASARLIKLVDRANEDGYKFQNDSFSLGGGWLKQGTDRWVTLYTVSLQAGKSYRFLAVGDMDAKDVDIQVLDPDGRTVASDTLAAPEAIVGYSPTKTGRYSVRVRLYASRDNVPSFVVAALLAK